MRIDKRIRLLRKGFAMNNPAPSQVAKVYDRVAGISDLYTRPMEVYETYGGTGW